MPSDFILSNIFIIFMIFMIFPMFFLKNQQILMLDMKECSKRPRIFFQNIEHIMIWKYEKKIRGKKCFPSGRKKIIRFLWFFWSQTYENIEICLSAGGKIILSPDFFFIFSNHDFFDVLETNSELPTTFLHVQNQHLLILKKTHRKYHDNHENHENIRKSTRQHTIIINHTWIMIMNMRIQSKRGLP